MEERYCLDGLMGKAKIGEWGDTSIPHSPSAVHNCYSVIFWNMLLGFLQMGQT